MVRVCQVEQDLSDLTDSLIKARSPAQVGALALLLNCYRRTMTIQIHVPLAQVGLLLGRLGNQRDFIFHLLKTPSFEARV